MTNQQQQNYIVLGFLLLSLLLHLLLLLVSKEKLLPELNQPDPVYVEIRSPEESERELDLPIREELDKPRTKPAKRLAEKNQVVEREQAPEGHDTEDRELVVKARPQTPQQSLPRVQPEAEKPAESQQAEDSAKTTLITPEGWKPSPTKPEQSFPDIYTLTRISPNTLAQIESDWRRKYREDVERGDTVWMDTQQDLLISFMRRFRDNIYGVWNYPGVAIRQQQQGTSLIRVTVDRNGEVLNVHLLESSGYKTLDDEVIRAVTEGATYGPLPRSYPYEDLKIMAFFQYQLSGSFYKSRRRPGDIY